MAVFNDLDEVGVFFGLSLIFFTDFFLMNSALEMGWRAYRDWYKRVSSKQDEKRKWLPWFWLLPFTTLCLFILQMSALYIFYQFVFANADGVWWEVACVTFFMYINVLTCKRWIGTYTTAGRHKGWTYLLLVFNILTAIAIAILFAWYNRWLEFGLFFPASAVWWGLATGIHWWSFYMDMGKETARKAADFVTTIVTPKEPVYETASSGSTPTTSFAKHMKQG